MTACLQVTDTDVAYRLKARMRDHWQQLKAGLKKKAKEQETRAQFKTGAFEMLQVVKAAHDDMVKVNFETGFLLQAMRRNFLLSWRPSLSRGTLVRSDSQAWAQQLPEGSHRIAEGWAKGRYSWVKELEGGKVEALPPKWSDQEAAAELADLEEISYCQGEDWQVSRYIRSLNKVIDPEEVELEVEHLDEEDFPEEVLALQKPPKERKLEEKLEELLADQKCSKERKLERKKARVEEKRLRRVFLKDYRDKVGDKLKTQSRAELLQALVPKAGKKKNSGGKSKLKVFACSPC
jgi:hypothetical protein